MQMIENTQAALQLLRNVLTDLEDKNYRQSVSILNGSSVGAHTRHVIELFQQLFTGYDATVVNYENRQRDRRIETDRTYAIELLEEISVSVNRKDKELLLQHEDAHLHSTYYRELLYNMEHTVHHMAIIRIAVEHMLDMQLPADFGIAASTLKHRAKCVQ